MEKYKVIYSDRVIQHPYIGKKGTFILEDAGMKKLRFKDGNTLWFHDSKIELVVKKPKRIPFDLERALAGDEVVTRSGENVICLKDFLDNSIYPIEAVVSNGFAFSFTKQGRRYASEKHESDLFMKHPAKETGKFTPEFVDAFNKYKPVGATPESPTQDYEKLKAVFEELLSMVFLPGNHNANYWNEKAGLL